MIRLPSSLEPLESRIAPAVLPVVNVLPDIEAGSGKTGAIVDLTELFDTADHHTKVTFTVNIDSDPDTDGLQPSTFVMELFDDLAPQTVQNFLTYALNPNTAGDYLNTFFHRSLSGFVVQGGGFDVTNPTKHIPVGPNVHNEFDVSRSNVAGTVAMAKTGQGPNTATSEWFVNLTDNSGNLDEQNGGFTVFGQITSGFDLFAKIAALPKISLGGGLTDVPVQNYNSDPDHNPNTLPPKPTPNQLIRITDVDVAPPPPTPGGFDFNHAPVITSVQGAADLIAKAEVVDGQLKLTYAPGKSGIVDVKVLVTNGDDSYEDTFRVTVLPNLIANITTDAFPNIIAPGDIGSAVIKLTNNGSGKYAANADGSGIAKVDIEFSSKVTPNDEAGTIVDEGDIRVGSLPGQSVNIKGGGSTSFTVPLKVPQALLEESGEVYHLIARVTPTAGSAATPELFAVATVDDDNTAVDGKVHALVNEAGNVTVQGFGSRKIPTISFTETDGDLVVARFTGPGSMLFFPDDDEFGVTVINTTTASTIALRPKAPLDPSDDTHTGRIEMASVSVASAIGTVNFPAVDIFGFTTFSGGALNLNLGDMGGAALGHTLVPRTMIIGALLPNNDPVNIKLGFVTNYNIESDQPIAQISSIDWIDTEGIDTHVIAPAIDRLKTTGGLNAFGHFEADVLLEGRAKMSLFRVAGAFQDATFTALKSSGVDVVSVGGMKDAGFFLGTDGRPDDLGDFTRSRTIGSFTVTGAVTLDGFSFINSQVAAGSFGTIKVVNVDTTSESDFGFVADKIASYIRDGNPAILNIAKGQVDKQGAYSVIALPFTPPPPETP